MSLHVVLGFADQKTTTEPVVIYAGRSGSAARAAIAAAASPRLLIFANPVGLPKNNPLAAANAAKAKAFQGVLDVQAKATADAAAKALVDLQSENARLAARVLELEAKPKK